MQHASFVHLHVHTYYSLLDGAISIDKLANVSKQQKLPAVAMTDHGNMFGAVEFYQKVSALGIKPILGCEMYLMTKGSRHDKQVRKDGGMLSHLVLLVKNQKGYQNLCRLISSSHLEGFYYKPRIDKEILEQYNEGLIALSGCLKGEVTALLLDGRINDAENAAAWFSKIFDNNRFFLELMDHGISDQAKVNPLIVELGHKMGLPLVATNDCHFVERTDYEAQDALLCIQSGKTISETDRLKFSSDQFYLRSPDEMRALFSHVPEAIDNTISIAERCNFEFDFKTYHFPKFAPPDGFDLPTFLTKKTEEGLAKREKTLCAYYGGKWEDERKNYLIRIEEELGMIKKMGFAGYFLIVADFIEHAKADGVSVGPGRGSAAGSLVAYALGITDIDPIPYKLLFERFLNPERISMPDMDIDFCVRKREKVIEYVSKKYGNVSQIITFGKMKARAVIRDVGRVMGMSYGDVDRIAKMIPAALDMTLEKALEVEPQLKELYGKDSDVAKLIEIAKKLEGFPRHASTHAAGVVISDQPLVNFLPLYRGQNDEVVTQFDMKAVESIGLIKFDFLGLKTLTLIEDTLKTIKERQGIQIDMDSIPVDDSLVFQKLSAGDTKGVFQLESSGMTDLIMKLKPSSFEEIVALVALFRPGPLGSGMVNDFIDRKHGRKKMEYPIPALEPILKDTYGVILYQEQVMQIASALANFTMGDADILRRAMGKKKLNEMEKQKKKFLDGSRLNGIPSLKAEQIFDLMAEFAGYGFNKSHSAAYALVSYRTAYLKMHYPTEFMAALLTSETGNTDKVLDYMTDCKSHSIEVLPPDINESEVYFTVVGDGKIRFGLGAVKNVGEAAIEAIVEARVLGGRFATIRDFCERIDLRKVNRRVLESLVKCGALDSMNANLDPNCVGSYRAELFAKLEGAIDFGVSRQKEKSSGQVSMFDMLGADANEQWAVKEDLQFEPWSEHQVLGYEKDALGFYLTGHPLAQYENLIKQYAADNVREISLLRAKREVRFAGVVTAMREIMTRKGDKMAFVTVEDLSATIETVVFSDIYKKSWQLIKGDLPLFFIGNAEVGEESVKVIVRDMFDITELPTRLTKSVHFHLSVAETDEKQLGQLKNILARYPGQCPGYIHITIPDKTETLLALPKKLSVNPNLEMVKTLEKVFGHNITQFKS